MAASPKPSKFDGLFKQAAESPPRVLEPEGRIEHEDTLGEMPTPQPYPGESDAPPRNSPPQPARPTQARAGQGASPSAERRQLGRPAGKRTDKDWKQFSVLLRHEDQFQAVSILRSTRDKRDFSTLMQGLLETWLKKQTPKP
jgi:hypothetical protein